MLSYHNYIVFAYKHILNILCSTYKYTYTVYNIINNIIVYKI